MPRVMCRLGYSLMSFVSSLFPNTFYHCSRPFLPVHRFCWPRRAEQPRRVTRFECETFSLGFCHFLACFCGFSCKSRRVSSLLAKIVRLLLRQLDNSIQRPPGHWPLATCCFWCSGQVALSEQARLRAPARRQPSAEEPKLRHPESPAHELV